MGTWHRASPEFITQSKIGAEGCQAKPQQTPRPKGNKAQLASAFFLGRGGIPGGEGGEGGPGQPLKAHCTQRLELQPSLAIVPTESAEDAKAFSPAGQWGVVWGHPEDGGEMGGGGMLGTGWTVRDRGSILVVSP